MGITVDDVRAGTAADATWPSVWENPRVYPQMAHSPPSFFHLHLISDSTGETLTTITKAATVQYAKVRAIEHVHPLVRTSRQLKRVLQEIEQAPGIVLYTLVNKELTTQVDERCKELAVPSLAVLPRRAR